MPAVFHEQYFIYLDSNWPGVTYGPIVVIGWNQCAAIVLDTACFLIPSEGFLISDGLEFESGAANQIPAGQDEQEDVACRLVKGATVLEVDIHRLVQPEKFIILLTFCFGLSGLADACSNSLPALRHVAR